MARARCRDRDRLLIEDMVDDRDVVHRQIPNHIYVLLKQPEARAYAIVIVDVPELSLQQQLTDLLNRWRVEKGVIDHQRQPAPVRFVDQAGYELRAWRQGLRPTRACQPSTPQLPARNVCAPA